MGYQHIDGFDTYGSSNLVAGYPWDTVVGTSAVLTSDYRFAPPAGVPGGCVQLTGSNYIRKNFSSSQTTIIVNFGFKCIALPSSACDILYFWNTNNFIMGLALNSSGQLQFYLGNGASPGGGGTALVSTLGPISASSTITAGGWYGIQVQIVISNAGAGSIALYLNGAVTPLISQGSLTTAPGSFTNVNQVSIGNQNNAGFGTARYDDFYCFDNTGSYYNTLQAGDPRVYEKVASGPGNYTNFTPVGLVANWQNVSVMPPSLSDYNSNNTPGTKESYGVPAAGLTLAPFLVLLRLSLMKDDAAVHTPSPLIRSGSTDGVGSALPALGGSPLFYDTPYPLDPATSAPWTAAAADAAQPGVVEG